MLRYLTAGESHGEALLAILEGMPAGLKINSSAIDSELRRRQAGLGRGGRMKIEKDKVLILSGLRRGFTIGSPIAMLINNRDASIERLGAVLNARPGHADLAGALKYGFSDVRNVLERASARETAARVCVGAVCKVFLKKFGILVSSRIISIAGEMEYKRMKARVEQAKREKNTVGGILEIMAKGVPAGLGSYVQYDRRIDALIATHIMSIPGIKALEIGLGFGYGLRFGSQCHDAVYYSKAAGYFRKTNNAGGIEGGVTNGEEIVLRVCMKPISTLMNPLDSVNIATKRPAKASTERSDTCAVEAAGVVAESALSFVLAQAFLEKFGSDQVGDIKRAYRDYLRRIS